MKKITLFLSVFIFFWGSVSAQKKSKNQKKQPSEQVMPATAEQQKNTALFIEAVKERLNGNYTQAENLLLDIISKTPSHDAAHYEYAKILIQKNRYSAAIDELKTAVLLDEKNIWYKILLAETYDDINQFTQSEKLWGEIIISNPQNIEYIYKYTLSLIFQNKLKEAINGYNMIEIQVGVDKEITDAKKNIWLRLDKIDNAAKEMEKLAEAYPTESQYYLDIADLYIVNRMLDKAIPYLKKAEKIDQNNPLINITLYNYYTENKKYEEAFGYLVKAYASDKLDIDEKINMLLKYYISSTDSLKIYQLLNNLLKAHPEDPKAWSIYADFLVRDNRIVEAKTAYEKVIELDDSKYLVWKQYLAVLLEINDMDEAYRQGQTAMSLFPMQAFPYLVCGIAASVKKEYENAVSVLEDGKKYAVDENITMQFMLFLAESYSHLKDFENSDKNYEELIRKHPKNATFLNNYSYSLSERNYRIEYALQLAKNAVDLAPNTAIFEDTYAWAFFKNQDYKNAKLWMEKALSHGGDKEYEILIHYSEILEKLGDTNAAAKFKEKAEKLK
jgi:predicted Zn-dependent protease